MNLQYFSKFFLAPYLIVVEDTIKIITPNNINLPFILDNSFDLGVVNQPTRAYIQVASRNNQPLVFKDYVHIISHLEDVEFQTSFENTCYSDGSVFILTDFKLADNILKMIDLVDLPFCPPLKGREYRDQLPRLCDIITVNVECALMNDNLICNHAYIIMGHIRQIIYIPETDFEFSGNMIEVFFGPNRGDAEKFINLVDSFNSEIIGCSRLKAYVSNAYANITMACDFNIEDVPRAIAASYSKINVLEWVFGSVCVRNGSIICRVKVPDEVSKLLLDSRRLHVQLPTGGRGEIIFYL